MSDEHNYLKQKILLQVVVFVRKRHVAQLIVTTQTGALIPNHLRQPEDLSKYANNSELHIANEI